jgi:hypothetical protein
MNWYVQVQNQSYGPYSEEQMQSFTAEGRINAQSMITADLRNGFFTADRFQNFAAWSGTQQAAVVGGGAQQYQQPSGYAAAQAAQQNTAHQKPVAQAQAQVQTQAPAPTAPATQPTGVFLIMAEINSDGAMTFLQALQSFGKAERISNTVWLLRTSIAVEQLRNSLSQSLNRQDRLFILDSKANKTAWFNIGADLDHRIRDLWQDDE